MVFPAISSGANVSKADDISGLSRSYVGIRETFQSGVSDVACGGETLDELPSVGISGIGKMVAISLTSSRAVTVTSRVTPTTPPASMLHSTLSDSKPYPNLFAQ